VGYSLATTASSDVALQSAERKYAPYVEQTNGTWISYAKANSQQLFMYDFNNGDLLSGSYSFGPGEMYFKWYNFN
jgi:hypothetical protein